jgi:hypothetical protein
MRHVVHDITAHDRVAGWYRSAIKASSHNTPPPAPGHPVLSRRSPGLHAHLLRLLLLVARDLSMCFNWRARASARAACRKRETAPGTHESGNILTHLAYSNVRPSRC